MATKPAKVAVIGAGVSGLVTLRHLASEPELFDPVAFELRAEVGGTWLYTENKGVDCRGYPTHSNMYESLVCNFPKEMMCAEEFPIDADLPSFLTRKQFHQYLLDYAKKFDLAKYIKLSTRVVKVAPLKTEGSVRWEVTTETADLDVPEKDLKTEIYDNVIVCNGNFVVPRTPTEPELSTFKGRVVHSSDYRGPEEFTGERVLVIGGSASGTDLAQLISPKAKQVYHSYRQTLFLGKSPDNLERMQSDMKEVKGNTVILENGRELQIDSIVYCTGYRHAFGFLSEECKPTLDEGGLRVTPLYKYIFHADYPSLAFIGLRPVGVLVVAFSLTPLQIKYYIEVQKGKICLPSRETMGEDIEKSFNNFVPGGLTMHKTCTWLIDDEVVYAAGLAKEGGFDTYPGFLVKLYHYMIFLRGNKQELYDWVERHQFKITPDSNNFVVTMASQ